MQFGGGVQQGETVLKILYRAIHIRFLSRNSQRILIIVIPNVLPQEEAQHGKYQPKQLKSGKIKNKCKKKYLVHCSL